MGKQQKKLEGLSLTEQLELAARSLVDPRTVRKYLAGGRVRGLSAERIRRAAVELGYAVPARAEVAKAP